MVEMRVESVWNASSSPLSSHLLPSSLLSSPVLSCPLLSSPVISCPLLSCPVLSFSLLSSPLFSSWLSSLPLLLSSCILSPPLVFPFPLLSWSILWFHSLPSPSVIYSTLLLLSSCVLLCPLCFLASFVFSRIIAHFLASFCFHLFPFIPSPFCLPFFVLAFRELEYDTKPDSIDKIINSYYYDGSVDCQKAHLCMLLGVCKTI